ncbi:MAG: SDR family oxidoreductase [Bacteriovoracaceae bacterium]|nr:SDR family oxidoreductase [Bacteriovoracaceae bacterium]
MYAIITGSSSGLGLEIIEFLLDQDYVVFAGSRSEPDLKHENLFYIPLDVRSEDSVIQFYAAVAQETDEIHLLVNNAGVCEMSSLDETTTESVLNQFETNALGPFLMLKHLDELVVEGETHIVNILSAAAKYAYPNVSAYVASKHALRGLLETARKEWSERGVRFSNLYPGAINTPLWDKLEAKFSREKMLTIDEFMHVFEMVVLSPPMLQFSDITFLHKDGYID